MECNRIEILKICDILYMYDSSYFIMISEMHCGITWERRILYKGYWGNILWIKS